MAVVAAGGAAALAALLAAAAVIPLEASGAGVWLALVVALGSVTLASLGGRERRGALARVVVCVPALAAAIALGYVWADIGAAGLAVFLAGLALADLAATRWGEPPWRSRLARSATPHRSPSGHVRPPVRSVVFGAAAAVVGALLAGVLSLRASSVLQLTVVAIAETTVAMVATGVRQWRFRPGRRRLELAMLTAMSLVLVVALGLTGWGFVFVVTIALVPVAGIGIGLRGVGRAPVPGRDATRLRR